MKAFFREFFKRGFLAAGGGPLILAIIYFIIGKNGTVQSFSPNEVSLGIISILIMAFIAGGITAIYQCEKLPLVSSILIHAAVLYLDYLIMYLLNDWIPKNAFAIGVFSAIFVTGFALVWLIIYFITKNQAKDLNSLRAK